MAGLRLFTSNHLEILADRLSNLLQTPLASPLTPEVIIVQSRGMERWLSMEIARRHGICANIRFPFPKTFVEEAFAAVLGDMPATDAYSPQVMTWKIMKLLPSWRGQSGFEQINRYLDREYHNQANPLEETGEGMPGIASGLRSFQLAERIASLFDQYLVFRPEMVAAWERGEIKEEEIWQSKLWQALAAGEGTSHPAARKEAFLRKIAQSRAMNFALPQRISIFGISVLPPFHLEILHALSERIEVNLFLMNPSREFWGYIRSEKERERETGRLRNITGDDALSAERLYLEGGNTLLASLGSLGREFFSLVWDFAGDQEEFYEEPGEADLLATLRSDILNLRDRRESEGKIIVPGDRSIAFHSCHSALREIEVFYDQILSLFEEEQGLQPRDILVMAPDIEVYAPLIKAIFDRPRSERDDALPHIPFTIADRGSRAESSLIEGFMQLLDMAGGRFGVDHVLAPLEMPEVAARFNITPADGELIRHWVVKTGIRWGIDGENRRRLGLPPLGENTWQGGLERLLMGYAMPGRDEKLVDGILPFDVEGSETVVLGRFLAYTEALFSHITSLEEQRTLTGWSLFLTGMMDEILVSQEAERERGMETLREAIQRLRFLEDASGFHEAVDISVIKTSIGALVAEKGFGFGFLAGGITFCSLLPMRSIPFQVIYLLGMNGDDYPRRSWAPAFDLMARHPQPCDRSRRKDDRYLFLEALLSARRRLIISYVGQSSEDNSILPPSVLVTELLDYLEEGFTLEGGGNFREHLVTTHRLQAFSPSYFRESGKLFSYSEENRQAAASLQGKNKKSPVAPAVLLPAPDESWRHVGLADLATFLADPVPFLLRRRLNVDISGMDILPEAREPFILAGLEKYALEQSLMEAGIAGRDLQGYQDVARASGRLPHGAVGISAYQGILKEVHAFTGTIAPFLTGKTGQTRDIYLEIAGFRLSGPIRLYDGGLVRFRYADLKTKDYLSLWIGHLALTILEGGAEPAILVGKDGAFRYGRRSDAEEQVARLLEIYWRGLSMPLKFFPRSSWEYGRAVFGGGKSRSEGIQAALKTWRSSDFRNGEGANPYYHICFGDQEPLDEEFEATSTAVLQEIIQDREKV